MKRVCLAISEWLWVGWLPLATAVASSDQQQFFVCTDYHCDKDEMVSRMAGQWQAVRDLFNPDASAGQERENSRQAVALLESTVGVITGTWRDLAGSVGGAGKPDQPDCISAWKNTTTYLRLLFDHSLLRPHDLEARQVHIQ